MKAKMTEYKGVYFRSRLEARWCEFFENLGVRFEYEPEKQTTSIGGYIPDFYFRSLKTWVEIKGARPTAAELTKLEDVCRETNKTGLIISSYPKVYPFGFEPHTANCSCYFISDKGKSFPLSLDEIYQITGNIKILHILDRTKPSSLMGLDFLEWHRYKNLEAAKAAFKPNKRSFIADLKTIVKALNLLNSKLNSLIIKNSK